MRKVIALLICAVMLTGICVCMSGCGDNANQLNSQLVGKWKSDDGTEIEFFKDGSCLFPNSPNEDWDHQLYNTYENHSIVVTYYGDGYGDPDYKTCTYEISGNTLTIDNETYKKQ